MESEWPFKMEWTIITLPPGSWFSVWEEEQPLQSPRRARGGHGRNGGVYWWRCSRDPYRWCRWWYTIVWAGEQCDPWPLVSFPGEFLWDWNAVYPPTRSSIVWSFLFVCSPPSRRTPDPSPQTKKNNLPECSYLCYFHSAYFAVFAVQLARGRYVLCIPTCPRRQFGSW